MRKHARWLQGSSLLMALLVAGAFGGTGAAVVADEAADRVGDAPALDSGKPGAPPKVQSAESVFKKLDASGKGYVTKDDVSQLPGFDQAFQVADAKHSGRLSLNEFRKAWAIYTGGKG